MVQALQVGQSSVSGSVMYRCTAGHCLEKSASTTAAIPVYIPQNPGCVVTSPK